MAIIGSTNPTLLDVASRLDGDKVSSIVELLAETNELLGSMTFLEANDGSSHPVLEQLNQDLLNPLIDIAFEFMQRQKILPEIPEELQGMDLKVEYISIMAQAQKMVGKAGMDAFMIMRERMGAVNPESADKFDDDQFIDVYADMVSVPPSVVRSDDETAKIREGRAAAAQKQAFADQAQQMAGAAKNLGTTPMGQGSALDRISEMASAGDLSGVTDE
jgi:hypothetical protein